ncbi:MAG: SigE family polymerase sigma factor [Ornithinibacter sp.]|jgi:RNA polymerase sigma-70 factor (sigma-E family)|nr:SigE family polymerase sigma factor [Ornithinibacter sp.]
MTTMGEPGSAQREADDAVTELYAAHWQRLVRLAWLLLHDAGEAEEVVQDAFVALHAHWSGLRDPAAGAAYLRRAVLNGARSALRHRGVKERWAASVRGGPDDPGARTGPSAEESAVAGLSRQSILAALGRLPTRQREVLILRYYLDLGEAQIADALDISPGSVKTHASRGLAALRSGTEWT